MGCCAVSLESCCLCEAVTEIGKVKFCYKQTDASMEWCMQAGMTSINDFATTYMCQSLPFGGVKESGFDRFAGIEGLRGMCIAKAVCEDRYEALPTLLLNCAFCLCSSFSPGLCLMLLLTLCEALANALVQVPMADEDRHSSLAAVPCGRLGIPFRVRADLHVLWALCSGEPARSVHRHQLLCQRQEGVQIMLSVMLPESVAIE